MNDTIDAAVSAPADTATRTVQPFAVPHSDEQLNDELLKEGSPAVLLLDCEDSI
jgi:hypothetical protein